MAGQARPSGGGDAGTQGHNFDNVENLGGEPRSEPLATGRLASPPLNAEEAFAQAKPRRQTGRRAKSKRAERPPEGSHLVIDEVLLLTREQAADMCQVSLNKLDSWIKMPGFPVIREGNHFIRIPAAEMKAWLIRRAEEEDAPPPPPPPPPSRRRRRRA